MSGVLWHTRDHGEARLRGSERAYAQVLCRDIAHAVIAPRLHHEPRLRSMMKPEAFAQLSDQRMRTDRGTWSSAFETWFATADFDSSDSGWLRTGEDSWTPVGELSLNTAIRAGNDALKLLAWMHGMCESHGRIEEAQHAWLAETIQEGLEAHVLRDDQGWQDVLELIARMGGAGPIVWSYTVCDSFPNPWIEGIDRPEDDDELDRWWYDELNDGARWELALEALRAKEWPVAVGENLGQCFLDAKSAFDVVATSG